MSLDREHTKAIADAALRQMGSPLVPVPAVGARAQTHEQAA